MNKNPLQGAYKAKVQRTIEPHAKGLHAPREKDKFAHDGLGPVETPRGHGIRASAKGRDTLVSSNRKPKLPGRKEPSGITRPGRGAMMFGDQGLGR